MKIDIDLKAGFLQNLKREVLAQLSPEEHAIIEVSTGEMGNKPDAVKLGWLKMRTKEEWTKQRYHEGARSHDEEASRRGRRRIRQEDSRNQQVLPLLICPFSR